MNRRDFLKAMGAAGCGTLLLGGYCGKNLYARNELEEQLLGEADPLLTHKALTEIQELPAKGREEIRTWFHGPCLNAAQFASAVTSESFQEKLTRCRDIEEQRMLFLTAFLSHVVSETEILNRVNVIAEELGSSLDLNWKECCEALSHRWNVHIRSYGTTMPDNFAASLQPTIQAAIDESLKLARAAGKRPALSETTANIGESAILLLPLARTPTTARLFLPAFVFVSIGKLFSYFLGLWNRDNSSDVIRRSVSARLALLGNRIGSEFESEMRIGISRLHQWQQQAVRTAAGIYAEEAIPIL